MNGAISRLSNVALPPSALTQVGADFLKLIHHIEGCYGTAEGLGSQLQISGLLIDLGRYNTHSRFLKLVHDLVLGRLLVQHDGVTSVQHLFYHVAFVEI